jgi:hypothetical protein
MQCCFQASFDMNIEFSLSLGKMLSSSKDLISALCRDHCSNVAIEDEEKK